MNVNGMISPASLQQTILVVDDDPMVLGVVVHILERQYCVLKACGAAEAMLVEAEYPGAIDLLLSDVSMPVTTGPQLAEKILARRPKMLVMFMSGYPGGALLLLNYGWTYIQKPFLMSALLERVAHTLSSEKHAQGTDHFDTRY